MTAPAADAPRAVIFRWPVRIYWEDTDAGGVVYHASYLRFLERARTEWLRAAGVGQQELRRVTGVAFVVHRMEIGFNVPARLDDELLATVEPESLRGASLLLRQSLLRAGSPRALVEARLRIACVDVESFRPRPIPARLLREISAT